MGVVYRAHDTRLGRDVPLKVLPPDLSRDPERLARFDREARILASLNHPNISVIHGLEEGEGGVQALVMELVEGLTLEEMINGPGGAPSSGSRASEREGGSGRRPYDVAEPIPVREALRIASEIAAALEAAHDRGIIHRDLKPSNIKVTPEGRVKVLDFGLAKAYRAEQPASGLGEVPGATTTVGAVLGTAGYMAPEQAGGAPAGREADIWAFGCVLYEALTGRRAFAGKSVIESLTATIHREPEWDALPRSTPNRIRALLERCLEKDPERRCRDVRDARLEVDQALSESSDPYRPTARPHRKRSVALWGTTSVAVLVLALVLVRAFAGGPAIVSLAVLPFENASTDPDGAYLSEGITETLIDRLSELPDLRVVPRGISSRFAGESVDLSAVGRELDVGAVVTGRVREVGDRLVVRAELVDVSKLANLWGQEYDRSVADILEVQSDLVAQIVRELRIRLTPEDQRALSRSDPSSSEAYQLFLKSRYHTLMETADGIARGLDYARRAVEVDPTYSLGHAALADAYLASGYRGLLPREDAYPRARAAAARAIELDETASQSRLELGLIRFFVDWDWTAAVEETRRAVDLDRNNADAVSMLGLMECAKGELDQGLATIQRAIELDPFSPDAVGNLMVCYSWAGRYAEALQAADDVLELAPDNLGTRFTRPELLQYLGEHEAAMDSLRATLQAIGMDPETSPRMALVYARAGNDAAAHQVLDRLDLTTADPTLLAEIWSALGEIELALEALERAVEQRANRVPFMLLHGLAPLRGEAHFEELIRRVHPSLSPGGQAGRG